MTITRKVSTHNTTYKANRTIKYIVLHYTAGTRSTNGAALSTAVWFMSGNAGGSADYIVDDDTIVQYNPEPKNRYCWAVGGSKYSKMTTAEGGKYYGKCTNTNSISIEMCSRKRNTGNLNANAEDWYLTEKTVNNAVELTKHLMQLYNVPLENVIMHHHVTGKVCPNPWCVKPSCLTEWEKFKNRIIGKDDIDMEELKKLESRVAELEQELKNNKEKVFNSINEVPEWGKATVESLLSKNILQGNGEGLALSYTLLRLLVINDRAGLYK